MIIGFTGPFCTANFGDWAMLVNNIFDFGLDNKFVIFTYSNSFPHNVIDHYFKDDNISIVEVKTNDDNQSFESLTPLDLLTAIANKKELTDIISSLDVLVVSGGGWIDDSWCKRTTKFFKVSAPIIFATQLKIPIRFMAQGVGPVNDMEDTFRLFLNYMSNDTVFTLRDKYCSPVFLRAVLNNLYSIQYLPDDLAFIHTSLVPHDRCILNGMNSPYVVLVINDEVAVFKERIKEFQMFCEMLQDKYKYRVVLLPFDLVWFGEEQSIMLNKLLPNSILIDINKKKFVSIEDTLSIIGGADLVLTGRHHAAVVAMQTHTPFIIKLDNNRHDYAYNKAHGVFSMFTENIEYDETIFIKNEWKEVFELVENHCKLIISSQRSLFHQKKYEENRKQLYQRRIEYIQKIKTITNK